MCFVWYCASRYLSIFLLNIVHRCFSVLTETMWNKLNINTTLIILTDVRKVPLAIIYTCTWKYVIHWFLIVCKWRQHGIYCMLEIQFIDWRNTYKIKRLKCCNRYLKHKKLFKQTDWHTFFSDPMRQMFHMKTTYIHNFYTHMHFFAENDRN